MRKTSQCSNVGARTTPEPTRQHEQVGVRLKTKSPNGSETTEYLSKMEALLRGCLHTSWPVCPCSLTCSRCGLKLARMSPSCPPLTHFGQVWQTLAMCCRGLPMHGPTVAATNQLRPDFETTWFGWHLLALVAWPVFGSSWARLIQSQPKFNQVWSHWSKSQEFGPKPAKTKRNPDKCCQPWSNQVRPQSPPTWRNLGKADQHWSRFGQIARESPI